MVYTIKCSRDTGITQSINRSIDADLRCNGPFAYSCIGFNADDHRHSGAAEARHSD